ncbi:MAG TPA: sarcosine oxidase subunit delta [Caulobacteraceae bacterium]|jgi:sarcosine oxidase subunit delta|nr:sarcosine oxidase subunit delta [Caulobacteraceae bacterium]
MPGIVCPFCGPRAELEFRWGGDAQVTRPALSCGDAVWARYLFHRRNPKGSSLERWVHAYGCRQWFLVARDTVTHEVTATSPLGGSSSAGAGERPA